MNLPKKLTYDTSVYRLANILYRGMGYMEGWDKIELDRVHELPTVKEQNLLSIPITEDNDNSTQFHKWYYEACMTRDLLEFAYKQIIKDVVRGYIGDNPEEDIVFQKYPSIRIQFPGQRATGAFQNDKHYGHGEFEICGYIPLTDSYGNATIWVETEEGKEDYQPLECKFGDIWLYDGANLKWGENINDTDKTRISLEFRVADLSTYIDNPNVKTKNTDMNFMLCDYWWRTTKNLSNDKIRPKDWPNLQGVDMDKNITAFKTKRLQRLKAETSDF
tara:strand:+ start:34839 stop:35663 length:825 start_codon:yes stop_codon:yes gene_type:complete